MQKFKLLSIVLLFVLLAQPIFAQDRTETIVRILMGDVDALKKLVEESSKKQAELSKKKCRVIKKTGRIIKKKCRFNKRECKL